MRMLLTAIADLDAGTDNRAVGGLVG